MAMSSAEFLIQFNAAGLDNINLAALGLRKLDASAMQVGKTFNKDLAQAARAVGTQINGLGNVLGTRITAEFAKVDKSGKATSTVIREMTGFVQTLDGQFKRLDITMERAARARNFKLTGVTSSELSPNALQGLLPERRPSFLERLNPFGQDDQIDIAGLIKRAAVTIPVWGALRVAIDGVSNAIPSAIDRFKQLDSTVAKMTILTDGAEKMKNFAKVAEESLNSLSQSTGEAVSDLGAIYTAVSSTGIDAETSLSAMKTIAQGSIATGADPALLARTMAGLVNTMGDTLDVGNTKGEKFQALMALLHQSMKTNAGSMNDFAEALAQAGSTAATSGMKLDELIANVAVLQTAMVRAGMGGTALRTALDQVVQKRQEVINFLDRDLMPEEITNQFTLIQNIVKKMSELTAKGDVQSIAEVQKAMQEMFGVKAGKDVNVLRANLEKFNAVMADSNRLMEIGRTQGIGAMFAEVAKDFGVMMGTLEQQQKRFAQVSAEANRQFFAGLFGVEGKDAIDTLTKLNDKLEKGAKSFYEFGKALRDLAGQFAVFAGVAGIASLVTWFTTFVGVLNSFPAVMIAAGLAIEAFAARLALLAPLVPIAAALATINLAKKLPEATDTRIEALKADMANRAATGQGSFEEALAANTGKGALGKFGIGLGGMILGIGGDDFGKINLNDKNVRAILKGAFDEARAESEKVAKQRAEVNLDKIVVTGPRAPEPGTPEDTAAREARFKREALHLQEMRRFGVDAIQIKKQELALIREIFDGELETSKVKEKQLEIDTALIEQKQAYADSLQGALKNDFLSNLKGESNNGLLSTIQENMKSQFQENIANNASRLVMSTGIGEMGNMMNQFFTNLTGEIVDPITRAHNDGGKMVYDWITKAWQETVGQTAGTSGTGTSLGGGASGTAGFAGTNGQPQGIWGNAFFNRPIGGTKLAPSGPGVTSQGISVPSTMSPMAKQGMTWGQMGQTAMGFTGAALTAQSGVQQMRGGGAKNMVAGAGQVAGAVGMGILAASAGGAFGLVGGLGATAAVNAWNPVGWILMAVMAVATIASMFMKGAKQTSSQSQTQESKIASKIDISNKSLELINRNLVDLKASITSFVLPDSAYYGTKRNIEDQWSLSARRGVLAY